MFTFILAIAIGAYISQRISIVRDGEIVSVSADYQRVWQDAIALFTFLGALCNWAIAIGRNTRNYFDLALLPWLSQRGLDIKLPLIALPMMPVTSIHNDLDQLLEQDI